MLCVFLLTLEERLFLYYNRISEKDELCGIFLFFSFSTNSNLNRFISANQTTLLGLTQHQIRVH
jgi:hypothetical protein